MTCRCPMCGEKNSKSNRCNLYRRLGCSEQLPRGKDKKALRRRLRHIMKQDLY